MDPGNTLGSVKAAAGPRSELRIGALASVLACLSQAAVSQECGAKRYGGIDFPGGVCSFADMVIRFVPGDPAPTNARFTDSERAAGAPDYTGGGNGTGAVSLGPGGLLELGWVDNLLTNSGDARGDLHVFEVGPAIEETDLAVRCADPETHRIVSEIAPAAEGDPYHSIGRADGSTSSIDIDAVFRGFGAGVLKFDAIRIVDIVDQGGVDTSTGGADIDAVGAISSRDIDGDFRRGDARPDGARNVTDAVAILLYLFSGDGFSTSCLDSLDANDDGALNITDPLFLLNFLFMGGPHLDEPYLECSLDPTPDVLSCISYTVCG